MSRFLQAWQFARVRACRARPKICDPHATREVSQRLDLVMWCVTSLFEVWNTMWAAMKVFIRAFVCDGRVLVYLIVVYIFWVKESDWRLPVKVKCVRLVQIGSTGSQKTALGCLTARYSCYWYDLHMTIIMVAPERTVHRLNSLFFPTVALGTSVGTKRSLQTRLTASTAISVWK